MTELTSEDDSVTVDRIDIRSEMMRSEETHRR